MTRTASVALNRPLPGPLTYEVPDAVAASLSVGTLVRVPLGRSHDIGCVVEYPSIPPTDAKFTIKPIERIVSPRYRISAEIVELCRWLAGYYFCTIGEALSTASMIGFTDLELKEKPRYWLAAGWRELALTARQRAALEKLAAGAPTEALPMTELGRLAGASPAIMRKLAEAGALSEVLDVLGAKGEIPSADKRPAFLPEQEQAIDAIGEALTARRFGAFLLHGVTGSGKTEVYLRLIERVLGEGRTALCLVPEISLTPQTVDRFARRFQEEIGVFHSQMSKREKLMLHEKIQRGLIRLVIGARSATFGPLPNLGLIVIDEEHEGSYKQGETPRYHARDVAIMRASRLKIPVVLGSATPSFESFENARSGKYTLLRLTARPAGLLMPEVRVIAMGKAFVSDSPETGLLSPELCGAIADRLRKGEQSLLFLNRRGFSNFLMCPKCKWVARCEEDDIVLTIHKKAARRADAMEELELDLFPKPLKAEAAILKCHFCGRTSGYPAVCQKCGEAEPVALGSGTQRIEEALTRLFPQARILRLDQDSVGGRRGFIEAWQQMVSGEAQIILGTQMIAKGLHLERVTLVGVILADIGLFIPDFRAEERTFSLLMQASGRAGRTNMGEVCLQTYMPHHAAIQLASKHDYESFFEAEMTRRRKMRFPPVERLIALTLSDIDGPRAMREAGLLAAILRRQANRDRHQQVAILGPRPAPIERLAGRFRHRVLLRSATHHAQAALLERTLRDDGWKPPSSLNLTIDVDPQDLL